HRAAQPEKISLVSLRDDERQARKRRQAEADGGAAEDDDLGHLFCRETPPGIEAVADGTAAQGSHADIMTDGKACERCKSRPGVGERLSRISHRQPVEAGKAQIGSHDETEGRGQPPARNGEKRLLDLLPGIASQTAVDQYCSNGDGSDNQQSKYALPRYHFLPSQKLS